MRGSREPAFQIDANPLVAFPMLSGQKCKYVDKQKYIKIRNYKSSCDGICGLYHGQRLGPGKSIKYVSDDNLCQQRSKYRNTQKRKNKKYQKLPQATSRLATSLSDWDREKE